MQSSCCGILSQRPHEGTLLRMVEHPPTSQWWSQAELLYSSDLQFWG